MIESSIPEVVNKMLISSQSWQKYYLDILEVVARKSTCLRRRVGALAVKDKRIIATGYNGAPSGVDHCEISGCLREELHIPSGQQHEKCMDGETKVKLLDGTWKTLKELAESGSDDFWVYSYKIGEGIVPAKAHSPRYTGKKECVKITLDNGAEIICTPDHKILGRDEKFIEAKDLRSDSVLMSGYFNHKVVSVESIGLRDVYDLTVPEYENYAIFAGGMSCLFTHNCRAVHAEQNIITQCARFGMELEGADIYCTHLPCFICFKMLVNCKVKRIYFLNGYPDDMTLDMYRKDSAILPELIQLVLE